MLEWKCGQEAVVSQNYLGNSARRHRVHTEFRVARQEGLYHPLVLGILYATCGIYKETTRFYKDRCSMQQFCLQEHPQKSQ